MKKIILILLMSFTSFLGFSQLNENFDAIATFPPTGWLIKDNRTDTGVNWKFSVPPFTAHTPDKAAFVDRENTGAGVLAEEWLITPQQNISLDQQFRFFTRQTLNGDQLTRYQIRVSSDPVQSNLAAYTTILVDYSETDLSTITLDQLDYEEKIINLGFTGLRYFAFVKVFTQPAAATAGDRWLVDDVRIVTRCPKPSLLQAGPIGTTGTTLHWTGTSPLYTIEYGPSGFTPGTGTIVTGITTASYIIPVGTLTPGTFYQYYAVGVCPDSDSIPEGPFTWATIPLGSTCAAPIVVPTLPYSNASDTNIYGNNITAGSPGATGCGTTGAYLGSNDVVYSYTATTAGPINITLDPQGATNTGVFVYNTCASIGNSCIGGVGNATSSIRTIPSLALTAGQTIYIVVSSTTATPTFLYNLIIQQATCPAPTALTAAPFGTTSGTIGWATGTATSWEVAVQPFGAAIPTGAGTQTNTNTNYSVSTTLDGTPLIAGTSYQYWVRADCGGGLFSPWSGPLPFNTSVCELMNQCAYTFALSDAGADGWDGGRMQVKQNGIVVATLGATITGAGPTNVSVSLCTGLPFELFWVTGGTAPEDIRIKVNNSFGQQLYAMTVSSTTLIGTTLYTGTVDCANPLCLQPTTNPAVPTGTITFNSATVNWNVAGTSATTTIGWEIYVVTQGSPAPGANPFPLPYTTTGAGPTVSFPIPVGDLLPDTNYTVYVRAICSVNGPSAWTGGTNFKTKEQCPKPTALLAGTITPFGATLSWTNPTGALWDVLVQLASLPAPAANDLAWVTGLTAATYTPINLIPETAYEYYVRTDCTGGIISNPAGPKAFTTGIACIKPTVLQTSLITPFGATFSWTNPTGTAWQVLVLLAGSPAPTSASTGWVDATTNPYLYNGDPLIPETNYVYYVRNNCGGVNGVSTWAGPKAFTTLPTCIKPTGLTSVAAGLTAFSVQLQWTSVVSTTLWQVLVQAPTDPAPTAGTTGWIQTDGGGGAGPTYTFSYPGLTPETAYVFYIRGNCEAASNGISTWTGPRAATTPPSCYKPTLPTATNITPFSASLGWTTSTQSTSNSWQVQVLPAGATAPTTATIGTPVSTNPYDVSGLTPNTCYDFYVRSDCGSVNGLSTWSVVKNFCTPPTCIQPTNLNFTSTDVNSANLYWESPGAGTSWNILVQPSGGAAPGPSSGITLTTLPTIAAPYNTLSDWGALVPGFYEYYVRSNCTSPDTSFWSGPFNFFIATVQPVCASVDVTVATTSPGIIDLCPGNNCVDLAADYTDSGDTTTYTVLPVAFAPPFPFTGGTQLPINTDDIWSAPFTLPFNFCFYGVNYPQINVGSNGVITFDNHAAGDNCPWAFTETLPDPTFPILNAIYGVYQDTNPSVATDPIVHTINYQVLGIAPCRAFVVNYYNVAQFSCNLSAPLQTSQIVLYETSNVIEVYVQDRVSCTTWNSGSGVIGIQNNAGTVAHFPPGRNTGPWEAHNEAWRFTPAGPSNVVFSWEKGGVFYSNSPTINVCVSETTNMTAKVVYTGCGGQTTTKTDNILLRVNELIIPPVQNVLACQSYTLPALTVGNYYSQTGGVGPVDPSIPITALGTQTIYVQATTPTTPPCSFETSFTVTIGDLVPPTPTNVNACLTYTLPALDIPFNYYTQPNGQGTMHSGVGGDAITTTTTLYIYGVSGICSAESLFTVNIDSVTLQTQANVSDCNNFTLPALPQNNHYYTQTGGPNGLGTLIDDGTVINTSQTIYIFAQSGTCFDEGQFDVNIYGVDAPTLNVTQPTCLVPTGMIQVTAPVAPADILPNNLFISEVTDEEIGSLTYVELFNGTGAPIDLSNYKLKFYNNGQATSTTNNTLSLTGIIANNATNVIKVSASPNQIPMSLINQTFTGCTGVNTNDNIRLTTSAGVEIDSWGRTDGVDFTPSNQTGYTYRRNLGGTIPNPVWTPADWTPIDPQDYSDVGYYPAFATSPYEYNLDGGPWVNTLTLPLLTFSPVVPGLHTVTVRDITTGCTASTSVTLITPVLVPAVTSFSYATPVCQSGGNISPIPGTGFTTLGTYTSTSGLVINASTGEIDVANSTLGTYTVTYAVNSDLANCIQAGSSPFDITITSTINPSFTAINPFCSGTVAPILATTSPIGMTGSWSPSVIDNTANGSYLFTPDAGQCGVTQQLNVVITPPVFTPNFPAIAPYCAGTVAPILAPTSPNGITGIWSPTIIPANGGTVIFTPNSGQCALSQTLNITVNPIQTPDFSALATICAGGLVPTLNAVSPNGITGTWLPLTISNTSSGSYLFTPNAGQCGVTQTLQMTVNPVPDFTILGGCQNSDYVLTVSSPTSNFDPETATYVWKDSNGNVIGTNSASVIVSETGNYTCQVTYQSCSDQQPFSVTTISCSIQKGISPKGTGTGDGKNDYFDLEGLNVRKLEIFNRYGTKVYSKNNYVKEWYGQSNKGDELPDGTYYYVIERDNTPSKTGWIYINHQL